MPLLPFLLDGVAGIKHLNMHDGVHPLAEGYQIIARRVWPVLQPLL
jgi:acyl-CoA thioesterase I